MRVHYHTFGCKANQYDTERMRQEVEAHGAHTVTDRADADLVVVNTCTVTNQADAEARRFIRRLRRERPGVEVVVAGCSAALREPDYREMDGVAEVVRKGENGYTLPLAAGGAAYADVIETKMIQPGAYEQLARTSRRLYETEYNWRVWGERCRRFIQARLAGLE